MKKTLIAVIAAAMLAMVIVGCGKSDDANATGSTTAATPPAGGATDKGGAPAGGATGAAAPATTG